MNTHHTHINTQYAHMHTYTIIISIIVTTTIVQCIAHPNVIKVWNKEKMPTKVVGDRFPQ